MGDLGDFPQSRDASSTTEDVAELVAALKLPTIVPLATDTIGMDALPPLPIPSSPGRGDVPDGETSDSPDSQLTMAQQLMDHCVSAIADLKKHQNQCAALAADLIERLHAGVSLEGGILAFDQWQLQNSLSGMQAELAMIMQIPEGSASRLMEHATVLVRELPATMQQLHEGVLGWDHAVVIAEEMALVQSCGVPQRELNHLELQLLGKADGTTLPSFREKARRVRERLFPESIVPRSRRAYADRQMTKSRAKDGMSWLGLYAPAPTIEGIWDQCTATAQAAQGPHEERTLTQLRADIAAALLLNQSLAGNRIFAPAPDPAATPDVPAAGVPDTETCFPDKTSPVPAGGAPIHQKGEAPIHQKGEAPVQAGGKSLAPSSSPPNIGAAFNDGTSPNGWGAGTDSGVRPRDPHEDLGAPIPSNSPADLVLRHLAHVPTRPGCEPSPLFLPVEPASCIEDASWGEAQEPPLCNPNLVPVFDDPDYSDPAGYREPDVRNSPDWIPNARPPALIQGPQAGPARQLCPEGFEDAGSRSNNTAQWPPLPAVMPIVLVPALSMLGATDEPAWMEGAGPISMEVARKLASNSPSLYRLLVDPVSGAPLDVAPEHYRVSKAMRTALRIRDEYCQFPGCMAKACTAQIDHIKSFDSGGTTTRNNLEVLCLHHHLLKHFKDDRTRTGEVRVDQGPERQRVSLRGWVPRMTESGRVSWTSPTGRFYAAKADDIRLPLYPTWLQRSIADAVQQSANDSPANSSGNDASPIDETALRETELCETELCETVLREEDWDELELHSAGCSDPEMAYYESLEDCDKQTEMPEAFVLDAFEDAQLLAAAIEEATEFPHLGFDEAA